MYVRVREVCTFMGQLVALVSLKKKGGGDTSELHLGRALGSLAFS